MNHRWMHRCWPRGHTEGHSPGISGSTRHLCCGLSLIELMVVVAILSILAVIAVPTYGAFVAKARITRAIADVRRISTEIEAYRIDKDMLPGSLHAVGYGALLDPWGNLYQYLNIETVAGSGGVRKNKSMLFLNSDFDLYSTGPDGQSQAPITAKVSRDDIIRATNGGYVGLASLY